ADGCDTLILGSTWRTDGAQTAAAVKAAHDAGMRIGITVDARDLRSLLTDTNWFTKVFQKEGGGRDGLLVKNVSFLANAPTQEEFTLDGEPISFKTDGPFRANAASFAICMRKLRDLVGRGGFLIGEDAAPGGTLLSFAEFDLHAPLKNDPYRGNEDRRYMLRSRCAAGLSPIVDSLTPDLTALAAMHGDTPIILWPPKDRQHDAWWKLTRQLPAKGFRIASDMLPVEGCFTTSSPGVHGTYFDGGDGKSILLLAAEGAETASVTLQFPNAKVTANGQPVAMIGKTFNAGEFTQWQIKTYEITTAK
ncbi:MAG: hypothetical protein FWD61_06280, partial [Phycisphaerales bacterium]|nr:hypothetical protein [Phycisphaerales bacterium]